MILCGQSIIVIKEGKIIEEVTIVIGIVLVIYICTKVAENDYNKKSNLKQMNQIMILFGLMLLTTLVTNLPMNKNSIFWDDIFSEQIEPMIGNAEIRKFYPWGVNLKLDNDRNYRFRVEYPDAFVKMINNGAKISKRANSADIILANDSTEICFSINTHS